ncbi:MAG TPA: MoxR family ATPase [Candidatus Caccousia avistercoris]|nr:MoxR family ATPase [Candidatus Caccousia avistercoris]
MGGIFVQELSLRIIEEVKKSVVGKDAIVRKVYMALLAGGHILLEDIPGVGKTTLALAFAGAMGLRFRRLQFTPDVTPSDITGYSVPDPATGKLEYRPGAAVCNLFLGDEINRTSPKTQSALLEVMEEGQITVDGVTRKIPPPFLVIATQNPEGSAGTQPLPESQLDRFMIRLSMGYPTPEDEVEILQRKGAAAAREAGETQQVIQREDLLRMQRETEEVYLSKDLCQYLVNLSNATRESEELRLGASPRATLALAAMSRAGAYLEGRDYAVPQDAAAVFLDVMTHRVKLSAKARVGGKTVFDVLAEILRTVPQPSLHR